MNQLTETLEAMKNQKLTGNTSFGGWGEDHVNKFDRLVEENNESLFSANYRGAMIADQGYSIAQSIQVGFNKETDKAEIYGRP